MNCLRVYEWMKEWMNMYKRMWKANKNIYKNEDMWLDVGFPSELLQKD